MPLGMAGDDRVPDSNLMRMPPETPMNNSPKRDLREELIVELMEAKGISREEAEKEVDAFW